MGLLHGALAWNNEAQHGCARHTDEKSCSKTGPLGQYGSLSSYPRHTAAVTSDDQASQFTELREASWQRKSFSI